MSRFSMNILLFLETILVFGLGVAGNKVAELLEVSQNAILIGTVILFGLAFLVNVAIVKNQTIPQNQPNTSISINFGRFIPSRIVTIFPFAVFIGLIIAISWFFASPRGMISLIFSFFDYEMYGYVTSIILIFLISRYKKSQAVILTYAIGFAFGISSVIIFLTPELSTGIHWFTFFSWIVIEIATALLMNSQTVQGLSNDLRNLIQDAVKTR